MNFGLSFSYVFDDQEWFKKIALAALVSLIPIVGQIFLMGWALDVTKRVINNDPTSLPDLDFGEQLGTGFKAFVVSLVYSIPIFILLIPMWVGVFLADSMGGDGAEILAAIFSICSGFLVFVYSILMTLLIPAAFGRVVDEGSIGAGLKFGEVFKLVKAAPTAYLIVLVGSILAGLVGQLGAIACGIGLVLTYAYSMAIMGHFWGQAYKEATGKDSGAQFEIPTP